MELCWRLEIFALLDVSFIFRHQVRLDVAKLLHDVIHHDDEVTLHRKVVQRLYTDLLGIVPEECMASQRRLTIDHHATAAAHSHVTGPAISQSAIELFLDIVDGI